jgi:hypothetical protein
MAERAPETVQPKKFRTTAIMLLILVGIFRKRYIVKRLTACAVQ